MAALFEQIRITVLLFHMIKWVMIVAPKLLKLLLIVLF